MKTSEYIPHATIVAVVVFLLAHLPGSGHASRPFVTEDAGVGGKGSLQWEFSWDHLKWPGDDREHVIMIVPTYGIADEVEMSVEVPLMLHDFSGGHRHDGLGDITIVTKFQLRAEREWLPALALKTVLKTTSGNAAQGLGSGALDYSVIGVASKQAGRLTVHSMAGYTFVGTNGDPALRDIFLYGIAADFALDDATRLAAEFTGNRHPDRHADSSPHVVMVGASHAFGDDIIADAAVRWGTTPSAAAWNTSLGLTVSL